jgi:hypothetical protein
MGQQETKVQTIMELGKNRSLIIIYCHEVSFLVIMNLIGGVMVSMLASSEVDLGFEPRSGQTKDIEIGICFFSAKHAAFLIFSVIQ